MKQWEDLFKSSSGGSALTPFPTQVLNDARGFAFDNGDELIVTQVGLLKTASSVLRRVDSDGNVVWALSSANVSSNVSLIGLCLDKANNLAYICYTTSTASANFFLAKIDLSTGARTYVGSDSIADLDHDAIDAVVGRMNPVTGHIHWTNITANTRKITYNVIQNVSNGDLVETPSVVSHIHTNLFVYYITDDLKWALCQPRDSVAIFGVIDLETNVAYPGIAVPKYGRYDELVSTNAELRLAILNWGEDAVIGTKEGTITSNTHISKWNDAELSEKVREFALALGIS